MDVNCGNVQGVWCQISKNNAVSSTGPDGAQKPANLELLLLPRGLGALSSFPPRIDANLCLSSLCRGSSYVTRMSSSLSGPSVKLRLPSSAPGSRSTGWKTAPFLGVPNTNESTSTSSAARSFSLFRDWEIAVSSTSRKHEKVRYPVSS